MNYESKAWAEVKGACLRNFNEQGDIDSVNGALALRPKIEKIVDQIWEEGFDNIYFIGIGGTYASAMQVEVYMRGKSSLPVYVENAAEYLTTGNKRLTDRSVVIYSTVSGNTKEMVQLIDTVKARGVRVFAFIDTPGSAEKKVAFLKEHPDLPHYFVGAGNQWGATYSYAMCYWEEQMWIRTKSITCPEFFHGMQEILVADTPVTLFMGEDEQRPLAERVARFLPKVCGNYTIIDTKELPMEGISPEFRGSLSHLMMHAVNNRVDAYMELFLRHPLSIRRYYRQFDY